MLKPAHLAIVAAAGLALTACSESDTAPEPAGETVAEQMPDTDMANTTGMTAPDAGQTGAAEPTSEAPTPAPATTEPATPPSN